MTKQWLGFGVAVGLAAASLTWAGTAAPAAAAEQAPTPNAESGGAKAAQIARGKTLFISYGCGWCHEDGGRKAARGPQLMNDPKDDDALINRIAIGSAGHMPAYGEALSMDDIQVVMAYIRDLKP